MIINNEENKEANLPYDTNNIDISNIQENIQERIAQIKILIKQSK
jgi:hypothetical protein